MVGLRSPYLNTPILKAWGSASRAQRHMTTGIVRRQFPSLRGTTWRNNGRSAWNGSRLEYICAFYAEITNIHGVKFKMLCYNRACAYSTSNPPGYALGIWLPVSHAPSCIGATNPSRTGLNPLNTPWKLHTMGVCIGGWRWQHSASDRTPNSNEPQICTGGFSSVIWLRLDVKIVDKHKAWQTAA